MTGVANEAGGEVVGGGRAPGWFYAALDQNLRDHLGA